MARRMVWGILWLFIYTACRQPGKEKPMLQFNPDPTVLYKVNSSFATEQHWVYQDRPWQVADSVHLEYNILSLQQKDSLHLLQIQFINFFAHSTNLKVNTAAENITASEAHQNPLVLYDYLLHFVKGKTITVWIDNKGRPLEVRGTAAVMDSIATISGEPLQLVKQYLRDFIGDDAIKDELKQLFCFLPGRPKSPGQAWVENIVLTAKAPVKWSSNCVLQTLHGDTASISCNSFVSAKQGGDGRTYMKGNLTGNMFVDVNSGIPFSWNGESETVTATDSYDINRHQSIHIDISPVKLTRYQ